MENAKVGVDQSVDAGGQASLHTTKGIKWSLCMAIGLLINTGLLVFSHIGKNAIVYSTLEPSSNTEETDGLLRDQCLSDSDALNWSGPGKFNATYNCELWESYNDDNLAGFKVYPRSCPYINATSTREAFNDFMFIYGLECGLGKPDCIANLVASQWQLSESCSKCFASAYSCTTNACALECISSLQKQGCAEEKCASCVVDKCSKSSPLDSNFDFQYCSGLDQIPFDQYVSKGCDIAEPSATSAPAIEQDYECTLVEESGLTLYAVFDVTFGNAVIEAWKGGAIGLSILVTLASGVWPYTKNVIMALCWFMPMTHTRRATILKWLGRFGKWSLVDVFAIIVLIAGVRIDKSISGEILLVRAEASHAIYAFAISAIWALLQTELIERHSHREFKAKTTQMIRSSGILQAVIISSSIAAIGLLLAGLLTTCIQFVMGGILSEYPGPGSFEYTGIQVGFSLLTNCALSGNSSIPGTYLLVVVFVSMVIVVPLLTLSGYIIVAGSGRNLSPAKYTSLVNAVELCARFSSIDVFLVSVIVLTAQFGGLIDATLESKAPDICPGTKNPSECLSFEGVISSFLLLAGVLCFWMAQISMNRMTSTTGS